MPLRPGTLNLEFLFRVQTASKTVKNPATCHAFPCKHLFEVGADDFSPVSASLALSLPTTLFSYCRIYSLKLAMDAF